MTVELQEFIHRLDESGLLTAKEVRAVAEKLPAGQSPQAAEALARELVRQNKLTRYQANLVYNGKTKGLVLGNYVLLDKIGEGGMGQVYKAEHRRMKRVVALKKLPHSLTKSPAAMQRFQQEVHAAARLEHPNIVTAYDADEADGVHFLVMQYVEGQDLSSFLAKHGPLPVPLAIQCIQQAARGLAYAHERGVIHRDIKPANLLLDNDGTVKVLDMGLARFDDSSVPAGTPEKQLTQSGQVMGTVDYMAPEQAMNTHTADARSDIYSLGCTLYKLLTGENMYRCTQVIETVLAHLERETPPLRAVRGEIPESLENLYRRMVAKRPEDRVQTMNEVAQTLEALMGAATIVPPPPPQREISTSLTAGTEVARTVGPQDTNRVQQPADSSQPSPAAPTVLRTATVLVEKSKYFMAKVVGTIFATIIAPVLVAVVIKYSDAFFSPPPADPPKESAAAVSNPPPKVAPEKTAEKTKTGTPASANKTKPAVHTVRLFNGRDLTGFYSFFGSSEGKTGMGKNNDVDKVFNVRNSMLHVSGQHAGVLETEKEYENYHLTVEYKWGEKTWPPREEYARRSGVYLHAQEPDGAYAGLWPTSIKCRIQEGGTGDIVLTAPPGDLNSVRVTVEADMREFTSGKKGKKQLSRPVYRRGAPETTLSQTTGWIFWNGSDEHRADIKGFRGKHDVEKPLGDWNTLECICLGEQITVILNGKTVNVVTKVHPAKGRIGIQSDYADLFIRKMDLQTLK